MYDYRCVNLCLCVCVCVWLMPVDGCAHDCVYVYPLVYVCLRACVCMPVHMWVCVDVCDMCQRVWVDV